MEEQHFPSRSDRHKNEKLKKEKVKKEKVKKVEKKDTKNGIKLGLPKFKVLGWEI